MNLDSNSPTTPENRIVAQITGFARFARAQRFNVGIEETLDSQRLAEHIGITDRRALKLGLKTLLCASPADWERFDALFDNYWRRNQQR
ncbi:MAG: hypothetical protein OEN02_03655, partial [Gammaproteobacteria bacterium]|nr:hypothetical protein [Gammaproteobacteria bacterium]